MLRRAKEQSTKYITTKCEQYGYASKEIHGVLQRGGNKIPSKLSELVFSPRKDKVLNQ